MPLSPNNRRAVATAPWCLVLAACLLAAQGCSLLAQSPPQETGPSPAEAARAALEAGNPGAAETVLSFALAPPVGKDGKPAPANAVRQTPMTAELLTLRAEARIAQQRYGEAEADALAAMALVPATPSVPEPASAGEAAEGEDGGDDQDEGDDKPRPYGPRDGRPGAEEEEDPKDGEDEPAATAAPAPRPTLTQRGIHLRLAQVYEDGGRDDDAELHLEAARELCRDDAALVEASTCELERTLLVRIRMARGRYAEAEPLVLQEVADVQSRHGSYDLRLAAALCHAARFYARQGKYVLSGPLFARSFDVWKTTHEEAAAEHRQAVAEGRPSPFGQAFMQPAAGNFPLAAPCGLEDQPQLLYKLGKAGEAANAMRYEQNLWAADSEAGPLALAALDAALARGAAPLDVAAARHAVAFVAERKGDAARAEQELRAAVEAYAAAWPALSTSDRRYHAEDYLRSLESLVELLRASRRFPEAIALGERAGEASAEAVDIYDSLRLDTLLSMAKTFREMRDAGKAEAAAGRYLDAVVGARGDRSADYAWALRTISYAYLLGDELDASQRMEMQARAIWAKQAIVAPAF